MYTTNKTTKSIAEAAMKIMLGQTKVPEKVEEANLHPNQQKLDVHEPEKDELTKKDFEMLRKGKKAPTAIKEEDAYSKDRYAVRNGKAVKDNPSHMGSPNYKDQPHHVWATSADEALKKKKVSEGTIAGEILKRMDEMKSPWPGTPEYKKRFPDPEMKTGEEKATKTGVVKKTIKGIVHTQKPIKEEVEVKKDEVKVLAKEEASFQNLINLYMDNGVESLLKTVEKIKEEASNDEYHKEVEENKKKAEGKAEQAKVAEPAVKAVKVTKEEVEQIEEGEGIVTPKKTLHGEPPKGTYAWDIKYGNRTAKGGVRKKPNPNKPPVKEEVEHVDESSKVSYSATAARAGQDIGQPGKNFEKIKASAEKRYGSKEKGAKVAGAVLAKLRKEEIEQLTDEQIEMIFEQIDAQLNERSLTPSEKENREDIVKGMKKNLAGFKERYGKDAKSVMYATATARAKGE